MPQSPLSAHPPILKGAWSDAEKLALLVSMIRSMGAPKWSNGIAVPEGRTLQACAKMYSELLKASAAVKMTQGTDITPSGTRPRGSGPVIDNDAPIRKRKAAASSKASKNPSKRAKKSFPVARFDEHGDDDQDDESLGGGDGEEDKKVVVKLEAKTEEDKAFEEEAV